jgi:hypothetical protein
VSDGNNRGRDGHGRAPFVGPHALPAARTIQPVYYADNVISTVSRTPFRAASSCIHHQQAFEASAWPHKRTVAYARGFPKADRPQSTNDGRRKPHPRPLNERQLTAVARPKADRPLPTTTRHFGLLAVMRLPPLVAACHRAKLRYKMSNLDLLSSPGNRTILG